MTRVFDSEQGSQPDRTPQQPAPKLELTTPKLLAVSALSGAVVGWFIVETLKLMGKVVPVTPWPMSLMLLVIGGLALAASIVVSRRAGTPGALDAQAGVTALVLGKTIVLTGALLAGGHLAYVLTQIGDWEIALPRQRVIWGTVAIVAAAAFGWGGWKLEKACWVPPAEADDDTQV